MADTAAPSPLRHLKSFEFITGTVLLVLIVGAVVLSPWLFPDPGAISLKARLVPPLANPAHPFGTDALGRDILSRVAHGGWISLKVGVISVAGSVVLGTLMGLVAGWYRGFWDVILMRFADIQLSLPFILLAITFVAIVGGSLTTTIVLLIVSQWVQYARLVRGSTLTLREREFILSARAIGVSDRGIVLSHILPNLLGPVIVLMTLNVANNILLEASLTFLGLGVDPTIPSWGGMLADGRTYMGVADHLTLFPGLAIFLTVLGFNLLGDGLRDALDPKLRMN